MAAELVISATSDKLAEMDWSKNIEICEFVACDHRQARDVVKAIKKRLGSKNLNTQLYAVLLLEMLMNNIGEHVHKQVIDNGVLPVLVKIVKKKSDLPVRERIFLLLDATQTSLGGATGKFPQYYSAYYDLVSSGVQFPQRPVDSQQLNAPRHPPSQASNEHAPNGHHVASRHEVDAQQTKPQTVPESSIIQKASNALDVLTEVLDAVDPRNPQGAKDEFTLDLVEQCSFQKQRVMHLVMSSHDEKLVSRAIELNEQLQRVLTRHDALLSGAPLQDVIPLNGFIVSDKTTANHVIPLDRMISTANQTTGDDAEEEEEPEQLFRRLRKGKACARPEDEGNSGEDLLLGKFCSSITGERLNRPLIRPLTSDQSRYSDAHPPVVIPPPPVKHVERERFFKEKKVDGSAVTGHMRGLSLYSNSGSSSRSASIDFSN